MATQKQMVMAYIEKNGSISSRDAFSELGVTRLSAVIFDLKEEGYEFEKKTERGKSMFGGRNPHYARYFLKK